MLRLKPITIIALDPHAAAFCAAVRERFKRDGKEPDHLIQMFALKRDSGSLQFEDELSLSPDYKFDLEATRNASSKKSAEQAGELFHALSTKLEASLIEILSGTHQPEEPRPMQAEGIEAIGPHIIYLMISSTDLFASEIIIELARLVRWLFATRFAGDSFSLESVVLLPELFSHVEPPEYASAYALLKKLDHSATEGISINFLQKIPPFEFNWLVDSRRSRTDYLGSLGESLDSYSDAFAGFLNAEPERSGALDTYKVRGKTSAYSTFGYAELYFPFETAITRLSSAMGGDIITHAFLAESVALPENKRKLFLASKQFILSQGFTSTLSGLENDRGAHIRHPFSPMLEIREGRAREYVAEMQMRAEQYRRDDLIQSQNQLESRRESVLNELVNQLDMEINRRADATPSGLRDALELLDVMTDPKLPLHADLVSEPQNFITEQLASESLLDQRLTVTANTEKTTALLERVDELRARLGGLRTTLRLMPVTSVTSEEEAGQATSQDAKQSTEIDERKKALNEIEEITNELQAIEGEYEKASNHERAINVQIRKEATAKIVNEKKQSIADAEKNVMDIDDKLREAHRIHLESAEQLRQTARRLLILRPIYGFIVVFLLPVLGSLVGIDPAVSIVEFYRANLTSVLGVVLLILVLYAIIVWFNSLAQLKRKVDEAKDQIDSLKRNLKSTSAILRRAHDDELRLEYELYAQARRTETVLDLIEITRLKAEELRDTFEMLIEARNWFAQQHKEAVPISSRMRRSVVHWTDIDAYYQKEVSNTKDEANLFASTQVARSQVRRIARDEFCEKLIDFTRERFKRLEEISIGRVLIHEPNMISHETALERLRELNIASQPLLRLSDVDSNRDKRSQRSETMWVNAEDREDVLALYSRIASQATVSSHDDKRSIRMLARWLYFPAYFLSQIDYFRTCYNRHPDKNTERLPDLVPSELALSGEARRALEQVLQADALGLIQRKEDGNYYFVNGSNMSLGYTRRQIAERFATDFASQKLYLEISNALKENSSDRRMLYEKLTQLLNLKVELDSIEQETLESLIRRYHPLS